MIQLNLVKYRFVCLAMSAVLLLPGIIAMIYSSITYPTHSPLKVGIDYTGGTVLQYGTNSEVNDLSIIRKDLTKAEVENPYLQIINANSDSTLKIKSIISIKTKFIDEENNNEVDKITGVIKNIYPDAQLLQVSSVGPTLGTELFKNSLIALGLAILGIIVYLSLRFQFDYALAAILGLVHDVLFTLGVFSILGLVNDVQIDGLFVTALLTVIGFSVHDTIVIFDRIRENIRYYSKKMSFSEIVNFSVNQTLTRSINTSLTTLITLLALYFLGGATTKDFVLAMIVGIMIGTYSSIFFCTVLVDIWEENKIKQRGIKA